MSKPAGLDELDLRGWRVEVDDLTRPAVHELLEGHLADMRATSPPESMHALDLSGLADPAVTTWTLWEADALLGCAALKPVGATAGEVKSMRTADAARGRGVAAYLLRHLLAEARSRGYRRVSLETGSQDFFAPARRLYERHGFQVCAPFADYVEDPNSVFLSRDL